jgi:hypothetical protein
VFHTLVGWSQFEDVCASLDRLRLGTHDRVSANELKKYGIPVFAFEWAAHQQNSVGVTDLREGVAVRALVFKSSNFPRLEFQELKVGFGVLFLFQNDLTLTFDRCQLRLL